MEDNARNTLLTEYEPLDLAVFKTCKIFTEKELEAEAVQICDMLRDVSKSLYLSMYARGRLELKAQSLDGYLDDSCHRRNKGSK